MLLLEKGDNNGYSALGGNKMKQSSFKRGFCRAFDLGAKNKSTLNVVTKDTVRNVSSKDWTNVGKDIRRAVSRYECRDYR